MLLHLVSAVIAILQFSSVSGDAKQGQSTSRTAWPVDPPLYLQCKGGKLFPTCVDAMASVWNDASKPTFTNEHQVTNWIKGCKLTWWTQNHAQVTFKSLDHIITALASVMDKCPNTVPGKGPVSVKGYRNLFVGKLEEGGVEVVIMFDGQ